MDAPAVLPASKDDFAKASAMNRKVNALGPWATKIFFSEVQALYLPALLRTFYTNSIGDFDFTDPAMFAYYSSIANATSNSPYADRFVRERQDEAITFKVSLVEMIIEMSDWVKDDRLAKSIEVIPGLLSCLTSLNGSIHLQKDLSRPPIPPLPKAIRAQLLDVVPRLRSIQHHVVRYSEDFAISVRLVEALANEDDNPRTDSARDPYMEAGGYVSFFACAANEGEVEFGAVPCQKKDLKACSVCKTVRYCSPAHQRLRWKDHKRFCFAPTW
ncbi:hypothetical protein BDY24DRAFT_402465 [Mrakia frigida]|uniref:zinc finger MYND domain-containing protein n=1 Tax=Mrakia frigida TaxID=29902 RepID=UPI003FCBF466